MLEAPPTYRESTQSTQSIAFKARLRSLKTQILLYFPLFMFGHTLYPLMGHFLVGTSMHSRNAHLHSSLITKLATIYLTALASLIGTTLGLYAGALEMTNLLGVYVFLTTVTALWHATLVFEFGLYYVAGLNFCLLGIFLARSYRKALQENARAIANVEANHGFTVVSVIPKSVGV